MKVPLPVVSPHTVGPPAAPSTAHGHGQLVDSHGRTIRDLRLSVTDRCNYRCVYCMDPDYRYMPKQQLLSFDEYVRVARVARQLGVEKLRLTGGEPTLYARLDDLLGELGTMGFSDIAMTTNGTGLTEERATRWRELGLHRLTMSMDSADPERASKITRAKGSVQSVVDAIRGARAAGLDPIKINAVIMRDVNDDGIADLATFAREHDVDMRLIEFMPLDSSRAWERSGVVTADQMLERIRERYELVPLDREQPDVTALNFRFADGAPGRIGIIASVTRAFCGACSRLRITADGKIRPCLFSHDEWDLRALLRSSATDDDLRQFFVNATWTKQAGHGIGTKGFVQPERTMSAIGG